MTATALRLSLFAGVLAAMLAWEWLAPRRMWRNSRARRWAVNGFTVLVANLLLVLFIPMAAVQAAQGNMERQWGMSTLIPMPATILFIVTLVLLDLVVYAQHVCFHRIGFLWRLHKLHHTDGDLDATTALRFHPFEIWTSMVIKGGAVIVLGASPAAVITFEMLLNATAMFNHANVQVPFDAWLRRLIVTPDMHRVHHSIHSDEMNRNFGFCLPWWDRLFRTYQAQPVDGHETMNIGLPGERPPETQGILWAIALPLR